MTDRRLDSLSPLDGRYGDRCAELAAIFSEAGLIGYRVRVEAAWLQHLSTLPAFDTLAALPDGARARLARLARSGDPAAGARVKELEAGTQHDVKAVEYYLREELSRVGASAAQLELVHFACTSEDVNNLSYALMLEDARKQVLLPALDQLADALAVQAHAAAAMPMLSRTHGQPATPTTLGKEQANFVHRLRRARTALAAVAALGKFNGAVGNYNAHAIACPDVDWPGTTRAFVASLGLAQNTHTTQIEPHDWIAAYCDAAARSNTIVIALCRDLWGYVSLGYFRQRTAGAEVGSSTMPHKVNPIDFENAEGNAGVANALLHHCADKLPVSRWQRDLTDSTVMRNLGVALGHTTLAWRGALRGLGRLEADPARMTADLGQHWEVLGEAIQTVMRFHGMPGAYERLKDFTRGREVSADDLGEFIATLGLPPAVQQRLAALTPAGYLGLAAALARDC